MPTIRSPIKPKSLFRYRSIKGDNKLNRELKSIRNYGLWGSYFQRLNDPMEGTYRASSHLAKHRNYGAIRDHIFDGKGALGICSFSESNDNPIMWAHYADQFAGICIQYDFERLLSYLPDGVEFARVGYSERAQEIRLNDLGDVDLAKNILSTKGQTWLYAREWRMFSPTAEREVTASINCVTKIYLGNRIDDAMQEKIERALRGKDIALSKMKLDGYSIRYEALDQTQ
jgi:hypothetical protein